MQRFGGIWVIAAISGLLFLYWATDGDPHNVVLDVLYRF